MFTESAPTETNQEFRPEELPRRGEFFAWGTAVISFVAWIGLRMFTNLASSIYLFLGLFLLLIALAISLGNWMDRRTMILLTDQSLHYENGLRKVDLAWNEIQQVQVFPSKLGRKVRVIGSQINFTFRTLGEVKLHDETKGRLGFERGEQILQFILRKADLKEIENSGVGYYYARK